MTSTDDDGTKKFLIKGSTSDGSTTLVEVRIFSTVRLLPSCIRGLAVPVWYTDGIDRRKSLARHTSNIILGTSSLKFGSGMAIPSLVALKGCSVKAIYLQELDIRLLLEMQQEIFRLNGQPTDPPVFNQLPLKWGAMPTDFTPLQKIDLFIAADCLYEKNDFSDLMATAAFLMNRFKGAHWVMCYHDRNLLYSIDEFLEFWSLKSDLIPFDTFGFDPEIFLDHNDISLVDDFPLQDSCQEILYLLEICHKDDGFLFVKKTDMIESLEIQK